MNREKFTERPHAREDCMDRRQVVSSSGPQACLGRTADSGWTSTAQMAAATAKGLRFALKRTGRALDNVPNATPSWHYGEPRSPLPLCNFEVPLDAQGLRISLTFCHRFRVWLEDGAHRLRQQGQL